MDAFNEDPPEQTSIHFALATGLLDAILNASLQELQPLTNALQDLAPLLERVHTDLQFELDHIAFLREEKFTGARHVSPASAIDGQVRGLVHSARLMIAAKRPGANPPD